MPRICVDMGNKKEEGGEERSRENEGGEGEKTYLDRLYIAHDYGYFIGLLGC